VRTYVHPAFHIPLISERVQVKVLPRAVALSVVGTEKDCVKRILFLNSYIVLSALSVKDRVARATEFVVALGP
jgi:hypothetical protein